MPPAGKTNLIRSCQDASTSAARVGVSVEELKQSFLGSLLCGLGGLPLAATRHDLYVVLALAVRDRTMRQRVRTMEVCTRNSGRAVTYLSAEFLPGPHLANNLLNRGIAGAMRQALAELGCDLDEILEQEKEP